MRWNEKRGKGNELKAESKEERRGRRWTGVLHDGTKTFAKLFATFGDTNSLVNLLVSLGAKRWISST